MMIEIIMEGKPENTAGVLWAEPSLGEILNLGYDDFNHHSQEFLWIDQTNCWVRIVSSELLERSCPLERLLTPFMMIEIIMARNPWVEWNQKSWAKEKSENCAMKLIFLPWNGSFLSQVCLLIFLLALTVLLSALFLSSCRSPPFFLAPLVSCLL